MKNKKILVTGSSGYIGSHVVDTLDEIGFEVTLFDMVPSNFNKCMHKEIVGDILNIEDIRNAMQGCDAVFHFAAQADIGASSETPVNTIQKNIIGTQNILEVALEFNVKRILFASTIYVYSELGSFYRVSKQACEKLIEEYQKEYGLEYTILRFGSLYGPRANEFNAIRDFLTQALNNKKIVRRGDGEEIREYIHVKDAAKLSVNALDEKYVNKHLIITGNQQIKIKDLLIMIQEIFCGEIEIEYDKGEDLHHYEITPFNYRPQIAKKITPESYYDLGQGLMDFIYELESTFDKNNSGKSIGLLKQKP